MTARQDSTALPSRHAVPGRRRRRTESAGGALPRAPGRQGHDHQRQQQRELAEHPAQRRAGGQQERPGQDHDQVGHRRPGQCESAVGADRAAGGEHQDGLVVAPGDGGDEDRQCSHDDGRLQRTSLPMQIAGAPVRDQGEDGQGDDQRRPGRARPAGTGQEPPQRLVVQLRQLDEVRYGGRCGPERGRRIREQPPPDRDRRGEGPQADQSRTPATRPPQPRQQHEGGELQTGGQTPAQAPYRAGEQVERVDQHQHGDQQAELTEEEGR